MRESKYLKANEENLKKFLSIPVLKDFETKDLEGLLKLSRIRQYEPGEIIIREGDLDSRIFFLITGKVKICKNDEVIATLNKMGDLFGEMVLISGRKQRSASVYAIERTDCLTIETDYIDRLTGSEKIAFGYALYKSIAGILSERLKETGESLGKVKAELKKAKKIIGSSDAGGIPLVI